MKNRNIVYTICIVALIAITSFGLYKWFIKGELRLDTIIFFSLIIAFLFNYIANGRTGIEDQDEREAYLSKKASGLSYLILVVCLGLILFITEGTGMLAELKNIPLVICFSISLVIYPTVRAIMFFNQR
ncbi:hypothetical protein ERJ70_18535 [Sediminibacillus dalangtanensis]|uniref:Uncharacterized protein n=1 Tax=Sediminibacillus dalangtanensis TaxID=2729421 RepID=A0ABX7VX48_9BACI|nr:hypothetical protein [Sediminibacillus dalangtanensis]QTN01109.1 hypothetical protein ERJ70_18535 [Sediminibacillus dalangtanensis]